MSHNAIAVETGIVFQGEQNSTRRPGKLVTKGIRTFRCRKRTAIRAETSEVAPNSMDLSDISDGKEMIDTGVEATFIQDGDTSFFRSYVSFSEKLKDFQGKKLPW